ncbi:site-specific integrase [Guyparkeria sp. GHLCS8-2]|uniref:tyrosine-type recombinase/integrase n=1 Tax=Guyparkeria halopsychrophila TaxID=3139421 RepID=UPI0037C66FB8
MDLFFSTEKFKLNPKSDHGYAGFPILISKEGKVEEEALDFCIYYLFQRGRVGSEKSWETYGKALYQFFAFCEAYDRDWRDVGNDREGTILAEYRDWGLRADGGNLAASTMNARLRLLIAFYQHAMKRGWVSALPYDMETVRVRQPKGFLAHVDASGGQRMSPNVMAKTPRPVIRVLNKDQVRDLLHALKNPTHNLIARLALTSGLRRQELATFPLKYVFNAANYTKNRTFIRVNCDPADMKLKNNQPRGIDVPRTVMADLWQYVTDRRHQHESISGQKQSVLFLTNDGRPYANDGAGIYKVIKKAGDAAGIPYVTPHVLRHTYATQTLYAMMKFKGNAETFPLLYVQARLGHASIETTKDYLHSISELEDDLMDAYQDEIDFMSREIVDA